MGDDSSQSEAINIPGRQEEKFNPSKRKFNSLEEIWEDDVLDRRNTAASFTAFVSGAKTPLTISVNGEWGTGKTFLLRRWRQELESKGFKAIYFNAWEDDFCDDPLVAIIGQLAEFLQENKFISKDITDALKEIKSVLPSIFLSSSLNALNRIGLIIPEDALEKLSGKEILSRYSEQAKSKEKLKKQLEKISGEVRVETTRPLVFIIDELDRCRPTFALELLERVKHIFDVPNMIFVFGINRDELCSSIKSIYGEIDANTYFRRFFDFEFSLQKADMTGFCKHLIEKYQLKKICSEMLEEMVPGHEVVDNFQKTFKDFLPKFCDRLGLSLRDIDDCMRVLVFVEKNTREIKLEDRKDVYPFILLAMIALRLTNQTLYQKWITGRCDNQAVLDYFEEQFPDHEREENVFYFYKRLNEVLNLSQFTVRSIYSLIELASDTSKE